MKNNPNLNQPDPDAHEIDLKELFIILWEGRILLAGLTIFFSIIAIIYSLSLPNLYKSNAILAPVEQTSVAQPSQVFGGLAAIAGINDIRTVSSNELEAIEKIQSLSFFAENIMPNIFLPDLMAIKSWDPDSNTIEYEDDKYNKVSQRWVRKFN